MAVTPPPEITPAPTPAPQRGERATFRDRVDDFITWLTAAVAMFNAVVNNVYQNALSAFFSAEAASGSASTATQKAGDAAGSAGTAAAKASEAATSAEQAAGSVTAAATLINALTASSTTLLTISLGTKTLATQINKQFAPGVDLKLVDANNAANAMYCTVDSYVGSSLQVNVNSVTGSGTIAAWNISVIGQRGRDGPTGGVTGGTLEGALWAKKGADVAAATAPSAAEVWTTGGESCILTGTATITGLAVAPQAGADVRVLVAGTPTITASANLVIKGVASGQSFTLAPGDELDIWAETTTKFHVTIRKGDGTPTVYSLGALHNLRQFTTSGVFTATKTGWHKISLTGGSGSGAACVVYSPALTAAAIATGSGAGGFASGMRYLVAGQSYVVTVGAGGANVTAQGSGGNNVALNGNDGNASSFSGSGIVSMTANGGGGGKAGTALNVSVPGGVGGTATGGDINIKGGDGGAAIAAAPNSIATGGGSVGITGTGFNGGACTQTGSANGMRGASGGAGVGGRGGNAILTNTIDAAASGGGAGGAAANSTNGIGESTTPGKNWVGTNGGAATPGMNILANATGSGQSAANCNTAAPPGGGQGGALGGSVQSGAGDFAGNGGCSAISTSNNVTGGAAGQYGGGAGGVTNFTTTTTVPAYGTPGSKGVVLIEF